MGWMQKESKREEHAGTKGALRKSLHIKEGHTIPTGLLRKKAKAGGLMGQRANMALRYRGE